MISIIEYIVLACVQFSIIRLSISEIGINSFGLWALIASLSQITKLLDGGLSVNATKLVVQGLDNKDISAHSLAMRASLVGGAYYFCIALLLFLFTKSAFPYLYPEHAQSGNALYAAAALMFAAQATANLIGACTIASAGVKQKSYINIGCNITGGLMNAVLTREFGLVGYAYGSSAQFILASAFGLFLLILRAKRSARLADPTSPLDRPSYSRIARSLFKNGLALQSIGISWALLEFITRWCVGISGGTLLAGYYELIMKLCVQFRTAATFAGQATLARMISILGSDRSPPSRSIAPLQELFSAYATLSFASALSMALLCEPYKELMIRNVGEEYYVIFATLSLASSLQILAIPFENICIATNSVTMNWLSNIIGATCIYITHLAVSALSPAGNLMWLSSAYPLAYCIASALIIYSTQTAIRRHIGQIEIKISPMSLRFFGRSR